MSQDRTAGYAERIQKALQEGPRPMSVRAFGEEMEERFPDLRGATYGGVRVYANGNVRSPRIALLRAMADVLEVRADWLAFDDGPMTEAEEQAQAAAESATEGADLRDDVLAQIREGFGLGADALVPDPTPPYKVTQGGPPPPSRPPSGGGIRCALAMHAWKRLLFTRRGQEAWLDGTLGERIGEALSGPFAALDVEPADLEGDALTDFVQHMGGALRALCPEPPEPSPSIRQEDDA